MRREGRRAEGGTAEQEAKTTEEDLTRNSGVTAREANRKMNLHTTESKEREEPAERNNTKNLTKENKQTNPNRTERSNISKP